MEQAYKRIILASNNEHKIIEIREILKNFGFEIISLKDADIDIEIVEDGETFEENAYKKANEIMRITGEAVLADDSGLEVDALHGQPGVLSARFSGEHGNDKKNNEKLLSMLKDVPENLRTARFVCSIVLLFPDGTEIKAYGHVNGVIGYVERGINGFGYDPLFIIPELNKSFAELSGSEKNAISHRGRALEQLREKLGQQ